MAANWICSAPRDAARASSSPCRDRACAWPRPSRKHPNAGASGRQEQCLLDIVGGPAEEFDRVDDHVLDLARAGARAIGACEVEIDLQMRRAVLVRGEMD